MKKTLYLLTLGFTLSASYAQSQSTVSEIQKLKVTQSNMELIVLSNGLSLYSFDPDIGQDTPVCNATCAEKWPPVILDAATVEAGPGIELGNIERANGLSQLSINGKAAYTFFQDRLPGDTLGDGLGSVWHLIKVSNTAPPGDY